MGIIMIIDGMADRPLEKLKGKTPLEAAHTPNMDLMAAQGINGIMDPIKPGIRAGSDTSHLSILGYDPYEVYTGRGPFEAAGVGVSVEPGDIAFRCNFSTSDPQGIITDRRAGRIREGTDEIAASLNGLKIEQGIDIIFKESTGHRAVLVLKGEGLSDQITDADPKYEGNPPKTVKAIDNSPEAKKTAHILNKFIKRSYDILKDHPINKNREKNGENPANIVLPRGAGAVPHIEPFNDKYHLKSACIAETGLIKGIGNIAGMELIDVPGATGGVDTDLDSITNSILKTAHENYDFLLINIDGADEAGHDGNLDEKLEFLERADAVVGKIMKIPDTIFILTADHSTPIGEMDHTGDPVPLVIKGPGVRVDNVNEFNEISNTQGGLCRIKGKDVMNILMDLTNRSTKFGA